MNDTPSRFPASFPALRAAALDAGFDMSCEERTGIPPTQYRTRTSTTAPGG